MPLSLPSLIFLATAILEAIALVYLYRRVRATSAAANWFMIATITNIALAATCILAGESSSLATSRAWLGINLFINGVAPATLLIFAARFAGKDAWFRTFYGPLFLCLPTFIYLALLQTRLVFDLNRMTVPTFNPVSLGGPLMSLGVLYFMGTIIAVVVILIRYYRTLKDPLKKRETGLIIWSWVGVIFISGLYQGIPESVSHLPYFPLNIPLTAVQFLVITYALARYGLYVFNPSDVASSIVEAVPGVMLVADHTGTILFANHGARQILGYEPGQLTGQLLQCVFPDEKSYKQFSGTVLQPLVQDRKATVELEDIELRDARGHLQPMNVSATCSRDHHGNLVNITLIFLGIAQLKEVQKQLAAEKASVERKVIERTKELSEAQARLAASLGSLPFGFAVVDPNDQIIFSNGTLTHLLGRSIPHDPAASKRALQQVNATYAPSINILDSLHETQAKRQVIEHNIEFGPMFFRFLFVPVVSNENGADIVAGSVLIMEDTTEEKAMERSRDEFFSIASHELRTPLTAIRGNADMMLQYYPEALKDPSLKEMVEDMHNSSIRLITIVNDFLDTSRLEMGKIDFKSTAFDMVELINQTLREYDVTGSRRKLELKLEAPKAPIPLAFADRDRTRQILINLLGNAIKFTETGGVTFRLEPTKQSLRVFVTDTGKGIPTENQHLLFHKFQQAAGSILTRDDTRSTGLGLYISRLLAEGMSGKLDLVKSEVGKGTTFKLELPLETKPASGAR